MIRGVFSLAGLVILCILLIRLMQGQIGLEDLALRGLVIVVCIAVIDKIAVPLVSAAIRATSVGDDADASPAAASPTATPTDGSA